MKTFFLVSLLAMTVTVMVFIIERNESLNDQLITVDTFYSFLVDRDKQGTFTFYLSDLENPLTETDSYQHVFITNDDGSKRIEIDLKGMSLKHTEYYLNERYWRFDMSFDIPDLNEDFMIETCFIDMTLIDQSRLKIYLGSVHFLVPEKDDRTLDWLALYGMKEENEFLSRIRSIHIELNEKITVLDARYGVDEYAEINEKDDKIVLSIPKKGQLLYNIPIILRYILDSVEHVTIINNFTYVLDYQILSESGPLIHVYAFD